MGWAEQALSTVKRLSYCIDKQLYLAFIVDGKQCGMISKENLKQFESNTGLFCVTDNGVELSSHLTTREMRSSALNEFFASLRDKGEFSCTLKGWRDETYAVFSDEFGSLGLFDVERAAVPVLGCKSYGVHMNGYVKKDGETFMWIGKRSPTKAKYPGCYDNMVAGGISSGYGVWDTLVKEAEEEAGISTKIMNSAKPVGAIFYTIVNEYGTSPEVEYVYDLELPIDFIPKNQDGEVAGFELMSVEQVKEIVVSERFKHKFCAGITIDFLIRHGFISPDETPTYCEILRLLHTSHPF